MTSSELKTLIEREAKLRKWSTATLCREAVGNNRLHRNLVNGGTCTLDVAQRFLGYIAANPATTEASQ